MKKYYATGSSGCGTRCIAFNSKKERDKYLSSEQDNCKRLITRADAIINYKQAEILTENKETFINIKTGAMI